MTRVACYLRVIGGKGQRHALDENHVAAGAASDSVKRDPKIDCSLRLTLSNTLLYDGSGDNILDFARVARSRGYRLNIHDAWNQSQEAHSCHYDRADYDFHLVALLAHTSIISKLGALHKRKHDCNKRYQIVA